MVALQFTGVARLSQTPPQIRPPVETVAILPLLLVNDDVRRDRIARCVFRNRRKRNHLAFVQRKRGGRHHDLGGVAGGVIAAAARGEKNQRRQELPSQPDHEPLKPAAFNLPAGPRGLADLPHDYCKGMPQCRSCCRHSASQPKRNRKRALRFKPSAQKTGSASKVFSCRALKKSLFMKSESNWVTRNVEPIGENRL